MDRRRFLMMFATGITGVAIVPTAELVDKINWAMSPGKKIFVPKKPGLYVPRVYTATIVLTMIDNKIVSSQVVMAPVPMLV